MAGFLLRHPWGMGGPAARVSALALIAALGLGLGEARACADGTPIEIHGFASQGAVKTTENRFLLAHSERGSVELSESGINFTATLTDRLRFGVQLCARDLGDLGNFTPNIDWFYLDYRFHDWLGVRFGRTKLPLGPYSEVNELRLAAEYGRWSADVESSLGPTTSVVNEGFYLMGSYQVRPWFTPGSLLCVPRPQCGPA